LKLQGTGFTHLQRLKEKNELDNMEGNNGAKGLGRLAGSGRRLEQLPQLTQHRFHQLLLVSLALFQDGKHGPLVSLTQPVKRATKKRKVMNGQGRLRQFKLLFQNGDGPLGRNTQVFAGVLTVIVKVS
jgi:hypothetical protein